MTQALPVHRQSPASDLIEIPLSARICERDLPFAAALQAEEPIALAVITGVVGASYRPVGAVMIFDATGRSFGNLSSGCIERDVGIHAAEALSDGQIRRLRYGAGSPYLDLQLPCGGGLDILVIPRPDLNALRAAEADLAARRPSRLDLVDIRLEILPELRFLIFGKGPETRSLSHLARAAGYQVATYSPDPETLQGLSDGHILPSARWPEGVIPDNRSAVALFFHDHDWEPPLLTTALRSEAFFIGAQGSKRAHDARCATLAHIGLSAAEIERLASPFGLIPSLRDPQSLAVSVLAQVLERATRAA